MSLKVYTIHKWCVLHRCVLSGLTASGRLALYTPPTSQWKLWKHVLTISDILLDAEIAVTMTPHDKAMFSFCTAFSWLPCMLSGRVIIAMATRSGHLVLVEVSLPVTGSIRCVDVWCVCVWCGWSLLRMHSYMQ